ncbi:hypothetical protein IKJ53_05640 [bacterium]|nr:hypothetical protein [bacterium]
MARTCAKLCEGAKCEVKVGLCEDKFVRRPVASESATGLLGFASRIKSSTKKYFQNYKQNIKHTFDHKVTFALVEKELFGHNSIDSVTHDLDKLVLYTLGAPRSFVSKVHRKISVHHTESGKTNNLRSMLCDNIASSPYFKPEKKKTVRDYYNSSQELQNVTGFGELLEKYNYGENLNFEAIKAKKHNLKVKFVEPIKKIVKIMSSVFFINEAKPTASPRL